MKATYVGPLGKPTVYDSYVSFTVTVELPASGGSPRTCRRYPPGMWRPGRCTSRSVSGTASPTPSA
jgi:hypothetical protein